MGAVHVRMMLHHLIATPKGKAQSQGSSIALGDMVGHGVAGECWEKPLNASRLRKKHHKKIGEWEMLEWGTSSHAVHIFVCYEFTGASPNDSNSSRFYWGPFSSLQWKRDWFWQRPATAKAFQQQKMMQNRCKTEHRAAFHQGRPGRMNLPMAESKWCDALIS